MSVRVQELCTIGFIFFITNSTPIGVHPSQTFSVWPISDLVRLPAVVANPFRPAVAARAAVGVAAVDVMSSPLPLSSRARLLSLGAPTSAQSLHSIKDDPRLPCQVPWRGPRGCFPSNIRSHGRARRRRQGAQSAPWPRLSLPRTSYGHVFLGRVRGGRCRDGGAGGGLR